MTTQPVATVPGGPLAIVTVPDGTGRLLVASQDGRAWVLQGGNVLPDPLLDIRNEISSGGERGLLGLAVHPRYPDDDRIFVDYTNRDGDTIVASIQLPKGANAVMPGTEQQILFVKQPFPNHNGGALAFGPDGSLYVSLGDGGSGGDPQGNGQNKRALLGKILRLDVDHPSGGHAYGIPADNPFASGGGAPEIWLYGLRNPWRLSFDRKTGDLWIGDVGQDAWEEVDVARKGQRGLDFGWNVLEASHCYNADTCSTAGMTMPVAEYGHDLGCTVIGGSVYRGAAAILDGAYLFADYCSGRLFAIDSAATSLTAPTQVGDLGAGISSFGQDGAGELYVTNLNGAISRLVPRER